MNVLQFCGARYHHHRRSHYRRLNRHMLFRAVDPVSIPVPEVPSPETKSVLPPPTDSEEDSEESRGLRGQSNALATLRMARLKCLISGSYGIKGECQKYVTCQKPGLLPSYMFCPFGKFFDHLQRICIKSSEAKCINVCNDDGYLFPDSNNLHGYLKCRKDVPMPRECDEPHELFSVDNQECFLDEADADSISESESSEDSRSESSSYEEESSESLIPYTTDFSNLEEKLTDSFTSRSTFSPITSTLTPPTPSNVEEKSTESFTSSFTSTLTSSNPLSTESITLSSSSISNFTSTSFPITSSNYKEEESTESMTSTSTSPNTPGNEYEEQSTQSLISSSTSTNSPTSASPGL